MITLVGNCQLHRFQYVLEIQGVKDFEFYPNSDAIGDHFDVDIVKQKVAEGTLIVAQPVMNVKHPLNYKVLRELNSNIIFVPYIFIDGIFSLSSSGPIGSYAYGEEYVLSRLARDGVGAVADDIRRGAVDFANVERFQRSLQELKSREKECCDVIMSDYIEDNYKYRNVLTTHNHPSARTFDVYCSRLFKALSLPYQGLSTISPYNTAVYGFSPTPRIFSPYDVDNLGLSYDYDELWFPNCLQILQSRMDAALAGAATS